MAQWFYKGNTKDGRPWFQAGSSVGPQIRYLYGSPRAGGFLLTASPPELDRDEPWSTGNNQVRLGSGDAELPTGTWTEARLYCGHDTGAPASGCTGHPRAGQDLVYYWCDNDGDVTVSCTCNRGIEPDAGRAGGSAPQDSRRKEPPPCAYVWWLQGLRPPRAQPGMSLKQLLAR